MRLLRFKLCICNTPVDKMVPLPKYRKVYCQRRTVKKLSRIRSTVCHPLLYVHNNGHILMAKAFTSRSENLQSNPINNPRACVAVTYCAKI